MDCLVFVLIEGVFLSRGRCSTMHGTERRCADRLALAVGGIVLFDEEFRVAHL